jgi:hypothetical protein
VLNNTAHKEAAMVDNLFTFTLLVSVFSQTFSAFLDINLAFALEKTA